MKLHHAGAAIGNLECVEVVCGEVVFVRKCEGGEKVPSMLVLVDCLRQVMQIQKGGWGRCLHICCCECEVVCHSLKICGSHGMV